MGSSSYPSLTRVFFIDIIFLKFFVFIFNIRLLDLELYNFSIFFYRLFQFYILDGVLVNLAKIILNYSHLNIFSSNT